MKAFFDEIIKPAVTIGTMVGAGFAVAEIQSFLSKNIPAGEGIVNPINVFLPMILQNLPGPMNYITVGMALQKIKNDPEEIKKLINQYFNNQT